VRTYLVTLATNRFIEHAAKATNARFLVPIVDANAQSDWFLHHPPETNNSEPVPLAPKPNSDRIHTLTETDYDAHDQEDANNDYRNSRQCSDATIGRVSDNRPFPRVYRVTAEDERTLYGTLAGKGMDEANARLLVSLLGCKGFPTIDEYDRLFRHHSTPDAIQRAVREIYRQAVADERDDNRRYREA
jgi:hypothetical protein